MTSSAKSRARKVLKLIQGERCFYCLRSYPDTRGWTKRQKRRVRDRVLTLDHIIPRSKGGGNNLGNLCLCCRGCNAAKQDRMFWEWALPIELGRGVRVA